MVFPQRGPCWNISREILTIFINLEYYVSTFKSYISWCLTVSLLSRKHTWKKLHLPNGTSVLPLSGNPRYARAFGKKKRFRVDFISTSELAPAFAALPLESSDRTIGKTLFWSAFFDVVKNVRTHVWEREAVERSRVCLRL